MQLDKGTATDMAGRPDATLALVRAVAAACLVGLIALGLAWELWLAPTGNRSLALKVLPLALALVGVLKYRMFTYRWLSLLLWLYFAEGVVRASSETGIVVTLASVEIALCALLFSACVGHVRWRQKLVSARASAA